MNARSLFAALLTTLAACLAPVTAKEVPLPFVSPIFGDNMVLQRDQPNTIWGWTTVGTRVHVRLGTREADATTEASGRWQVRVEPPAVGTECTLTIDGPQHREFRHLIVGDVWLCGGQSNMEFGLPAAKNGAAEVAAANHPDIRLYRVPRRSAYSPVPATATASWQVCTPEAVAADGGFSAVAYFFARRIQAETGVPIGLVEDCLGGTPAECWMDRATVEATHLFDEPLQVIDALRARGGPEYGNYVMHWYDQYDAGVHGRAWSEPALGDSDWKPLPLLSAFPDLGFADTPAVVWFRRTITLPDPLPAGQATLHLGVVEKMDTAWINGRFVGASSWVENPRQYRVAPGILQPGANTLVLRVLKLKSKNAFLSPAETIKLEFAGGPTLPLAGEWKTKVGVDARPPHPLPLGYENYPIMPTVLFNGMIHPVVPLALKGALWYQGEANTFHPDKYRTLLPALIGDWRRVFGQGAFPFLIVQLPRFQAHRDQPGTDGWAELRAAQAFTAATVPNTGLAVTIDTGDADNIHPTNKQPVGDRLAALALVKAYGKAIPAESPTLRAVERRGNVLVLRFAHADGGLRVQGASLEEFSVAGADGVWHWAEARLDGETVIVSCAEVSAPVQVRYAWQSNPRATLFNGAGFPAAPFQSGIGPVPYPLR